MRFTFNTPEMKGRRQGLRNDMPKAERILWRLIKGNRLNGYKFRRQYGVGPFVMDFYCPEARLGIELDGASHFEPGAQEYDRRREAYIEAHGITIIRFLNADVRHAPEWVLERILEVLSGTTPAPS